jgi:hypothetical protein
VANVTEHKMGSLGTQRMEGDLKGDFTRYTFNPQKHFMRVLMQQGRVLLDSDFNEQAAILLHYMQALARDLIGPHGGPEDNCGFEIITSPERLEELEPIPENIGDLKEALEAGDFIIGKGHYYVDGVLCQNEDYVPFRKQPDSPDPGQLEDDSSYLVYLDVWERHITPNEDDDIREVGLGAHDTAARSALVWQVKASKLQGDEETQDCEMLLQEKLETLRQPGRGELSARTRSTERPDNPCVIPPESRYRGTENQLYRVEIHESGTLTQHKETSAAGQQEDDDYGLGRQGQAAGNNVATFVWSRDNGSITFPIIELNGNLAVVQHLGRDSGHTLSPNDLVEVVDDDRVKRGHAGKLFLVDKVDTLNSTVLLKESANGDSPPSYDQADRQKKHPLLRRWDSPAAVGVTVSDAPDEGWIPLEDGIEVKFHVGDKEEDSFKTGDYWLFPARTATSGIEWPQRGNPPNQEPRTMPPHGTTHHYAPLAIISVNNEIESDPDCRSCFGQLRKPLPPQSAIDRTVWISPLNFVVSEGAQDWEALSISRGFADNAIRVKSKRSGDLRWILLPLPIPTDLKIKKLSVCYQLSNSRSLISQIKLTEQKEPPSTTVIHDDSTELTSTTSTCYESNVGGWQPQKAITLGLGLKFGNASDHIDIGAIGVILGS